MRLAVILLLFILSCGCAKADFFQNNNPFPMETRTTEMQNIYATNPDVMQKEERTEKKMKWWHKKNNSTEETETVNEGIQNNGSFYVFPSK